MYLLLKTSFSANKIYLMEELKIHLENCYGLKRFKHKFNFSESKTQLIYAENGVMKSSLALTLEDIAEERNSKDSIFLNKINHREVKIDGIDIEKDEIFFIQRRKAVDFKKASTILANEKLKKNMTNLKSNESKINFLKQIQSLFRIKSNVVKN